MTLGELTGIVETLPPDTMVSLSFAGVCDRPRGLAFLDSGTATIRAAQLADRLRGLPRRTMFRPTGDGPTDANTAVFLIDSIFDEGRTIAGLEPNALGRMVPY